jgi:hypothetical protein
VSHAHAEREPSSTGRPSSWKVAAPSTVLHCRAFESGTLGIAPMSAYSAPPPRSAAIVLTHGMPSYFFRISSSCCTDCAMSVSRKWLNTRKLSAFASAIANAVTGVHGSGTPTSEFMIGP